LTRSSLPKPRIPPWLGTTDLATAEMFANPHLAAYAAFGLPGANLAPHLPSPYAVLDGASCSVARQVDGTVVLAGVLTQRDAGVPGCEALHHVPFWCRCC
jgi:hypothetical protein